MRYPTQSRIRQQGYSIVELSVAVVIALFLLTGLFSILQGTRKTSTNQTALAQLQDNERIAVMVMNDVIQEAGHYDNSASYVTAPTTQFPLASPFVAGQVIAGDVNSNGSAYGESLTVRYSQDTTNTMLDCAGRTLGAIPTVNTMQFMVAPITPSGQTTAVNTLECITNGGNPVPIVNNVNSITFWYGVAAGGATAVTNYVQAATLTANAGSGSHPDWTDVYSVKMTLVFPNPLAGQPGATSAAAATLKFTRVVSIMGKNGVNNHP